ncbi:MAG: hypothetical protein WC675_05715 [Patescibacteria group bacterium]|jgi:hypothetical protein
MADNIEDQNRRDWERLKFEQRNKNDQALAEEQEKRRQTKIQQEQDLAEIDKRRNQLPTYPSATEGPITQADRQDRGARRAEQAATAAQAAGSALETQGKGMKYAGKGTKVAGGALGSGIGAGVGGTVGAVGGILGGPQGMAAGFRAGAKTGSKVGKRIGQAPGQGIEKVGQGLERTGKGIKDQARNTRQMARDFRRGSISDKREGEGKIKQMAMAPSRQGSSTLLKGAWLNLIISFGLTWFYIAFHFIAAYLTPFSDLFCRFGEEWLPKQVTDKAGKIGKTTSKTLEWVEIIGCLLIGLLIFALILFILVLFGSIIYVIENPKVLLGVGWDIGWGIIKNAFSKATDYLMD